MENALWEAQAMGRTTGECAASSCSAEVQRGMVLMADIANKYPVLLGRETLWKFQPMVA